MSKPFLAVFGGLAAMAPLATASVLVPTAAPAQVTSVITGQTVYSGLPGSGSGQPVASSATQLAVLGEGGNGYNNYQVSTAVTPSDIDFADNATALGSFSSLTTTTAVNITFTNNGPVAVAPTLQSQITPGGFGMYVADPGLNPTFVGGVVGDANQSPEVGASPSCECVADTRLNQYAAGPGNYGVPGYANEIAGASFSFTVLSNGVMVEDISGSLTLAYNPAPGGSPIYTLTLSPQAVAALPTFRLITSPGDPSALGYQWDAADLTVPLGGLLAPGASDTVSYDTTVTAYTLAGMSVVANNGRGQYFIDPQILAYSGFGDPIGRGGGGTPPDASRPDADGVPGSGTIQDVYFPRFQLGLPTFDPVTGDLSLPVSPTELPALPLTYTEAVVPEPEAWTLMLAGLGGVGLAMRRRARPRTA